MDADAVTQLIKDEITKSIAPGGVLADALEAIKRPGEQALREVSDLTERVSALDKTEKELDEKVYRILRSYKDADLFGDNTKPRESVDEILADAHCNSVAEVASRKSVFVYRDEAELLPLKNNQRALVIEQSIPRQFCPNDGHWYAGMFYDRLCEFSNELSYIETGMKCTSEQEELIFENLDQFDVVIITNWYYRDEVGSNTRLVRRIAEAGKKVIVVGDTPYEGHSLPKEAGTAIVQFGVTPISIRVTAEVIFGKSEPEAVWPIEHRP